MAGLLLIGLAPFAVMGITVGHLLSVEAMMPAVAGPVVLFALLGGAFGLLFTGGVGLTIVKLLPSYWLVQAGKSASGGGDTGRPRGGSWSPSGSSFSSRSPCSSTGAIRAASELADRVI